MILAKAYVFFRGKYGDGRVDGAARDDALKTVPKMGVGVRCTGRKHAR